MGANTPVLLPPSFIARISGCRPRLIRPAPGLIKKKSSGRRHDTNRTALASISTKKIQFVLTILALAALPFLMTNVDQLVRPDHDFVIDEGAKQSIIEENVNIAAASAKRLAPLDPKYKFSFVHISKCAGSTWIRLFKKILKLNVCPKEEAGIEQSVSYQKQNTCRDADYNLISLRSPRHHVWSQFTMCKYSAWGNMTTAGEHFPRSGSKYEDDEVDFDSWLAHFLVDSTHYYNCYHPANFQTRALSSKRRYVGSGVGGSNPNITLAMNTYNDLDFVALVEFVHESECMLYHRLGRNAPPAAILYLNKSCHCEKQHEDYGQGTVHVMHHNMGKRSNLRDLPPAILSKVANLTFADSQIYVNALKNFFGEMAWLESEAALGRRVVCDSVLKMWEPELAYLDGGNFSVTQLYYNSARQLRM